MLFNHSVAHTCTRTLCAQKEYFEILLELSENAKLRDNSRQLQRWLEKCCQVLDRCDTIVNSYDELQQKIDVLSKSMSC